MWKLTLFMDSIRLGHICLPCKLIKVILFSFFLIHVKLLCSDWQEQTLEPILGLQIVRDLVCATIGEAQYYFRFKSFVKSLGEGKIEMVQDHAKKARRNYKSRYCLKTVER